jgi:hypothetical protein
MRTNLLPTAWLAVLSLIAPAFCLAQQPASQPTTANPDDQLATIAGTVVSANMGEPLKKAQVVLEQKETDAAAPTEHDLTATTDAAGRFSIEKIPAGSYDLTVTRTNYLQSRYGQDEPDKPGATLSLAPGKKITDLLFRLRRKQITGRVTDEDGDPIRGVNVMSFLHSTVHGKPKVSPNESDRTNDLGEYRIVDLAPGRYSIRGTVAPDVLWMGAPQQFPQLDTSSVCVFNGYCIRWKHLRGDADVCAEASRDLS